MIVKKARRRPNARGLASNVRDITDYITHGEILGREIGDMADYATQGEKVLHAEGMNFLCDDYPSQRAEMVALAKASRRSDNPITHYILSWHENERPTIEQAREAVSIFLEEMGLAGHQTFWAIHQNTENFHTHIAINRVHPETRKVRHIDFEKIVACRAVARIEHEQGWQPEKNALFLYRDGKLVRRDLGQDTPRLHPRAADAEAHSGESSAQRRAQERALPILQAATSWQELHERLAEIGMAYERHGGGAVITVGDRAVKASSIHRQASLKAMEKRLGVYEPARGVEVRKIENKEPLQAIHANPALYRVWQVFEKERATVAHGQPLSFKSYLRDNGYGALAREWGRREYHPTPLKRSLMLNTIQGTVSGPATTTYGPSGANSEMTFRIGKGIDPHPIEALKSVGLEPAKVIMTPNQSLVVVLKSDRALGREARERLTMEVQRVVPGAQEMDLPEHGMVLEARGVVFSRCREIAGEAERARDRDGGLEL